MKKRGDATPVPLGTHLGYRFVAKSRFDEILAVSDGNPRNKRGKFMGGSGFFTVKTSSQPTIGPRRYVFNKSTNKVETDVLLAHAHSYVRSDLYTTPPAMPAPTEKSVSADNYGYGATLWKRARPGNPTASAFSSAGELLREGIPTLPLQLMNRLRPLVGIGKEYLNWHFGWAPLLSDIRKMHETQQRMSRTLDRLRSQNGQSLYRRRDLEPIITTTVNDTEQAGALNIGPNLVAYGDMGRTRITVRSEYTKRIWMVARYRYYVPDIGSDAWTKRATLALYGANPTPEAIWNLLPWSWLVDWFSNVGDVLSNLSSNAVDNLVAEYAYLMVHQTMIVTNEASNSGFAAVNTASRFAPAVPAFTVAHVQKTESKWRGIVSPYGPGLTWEGFSPYQLSILGALGISRGRR